MIRKFWQFGTTAALALSLAACAGPIDPNESTLLDDEDNGVVTSSAGLADGTNRYKVGAAYNAERDAFSSRCLDFSQLTPDDYVQTAPITADVEYKYINNYKEAMEEFEGSVEGEIDMDGFKLEGGFEMVEKATSNSNSLTIVVGFNARNGEYSIKEDAISKIGYSEIGKSVLGAEAEEIVSKCGHTWVKGFSLGVSFYGLIKIEFQNKTDRDLFKGNLKLKIDDLGDVEGEMKKVMEKVMRSSTVSVKLFQHGGNALDLPNAVGDRVAECSISKSPDACVDTAQSVFKYLKTIKTQLNLVGEQGSTPTVNPELYHKYSPILESYSAISPNADGLKLEPYEITALEAKNLENARDVIIRNYLAEMRTKLRVQAMIDNELYSSVSHREQLVDLSRENLKRLFVIADHYKRCFAKKDYPVCKSGVMNLPAELAKIPMDLNLLVVKTDDFMSACTLGQSYYDAFQSQGTGESELGSEYRDAFSSIMNTEYMRRYQNNSWFVFESVVGDNGVWGPGDRFAPASGGTMEPVQNATLRNVDASLLQGPLVYLQGRPLWVCADIKRLLDRNGGVVKLGKAAGESSLVISNAEPASFYRFAKEIDLSNNEIKDGLASLGGTRAITIDLSNNNIQFLDGLVSPKLEELNLRNNPVSALTLKDLGNPANLKQLNLSNANIKLKEIEQIGDDSGAFFEGVARIAIPAAPKLETLNLLNSIAGDDDVVKDALIDLIVERSGDFPKLAQVLVNHPACGQAEDEMAQEFKDILECQ